MSIPPRTKMWLNVSCATGLTKLKKDKFCQEILEQIETATQQREAAEETVRERRRALINSNAQDTEEAERQWEEAERQWEEAKEKFNEINRREESLPKDGDPPNPFVIISIDDEEDTQVKPMLYTKAVRRTTNPIWKEKFDEFPLEMYLTGKMCYESFHNGDDNYRPQKLVFYIYHDDSTLEEGKQKPKPSDDSWKREKPQRMLLIGKAEWDWFDLCRKVGCPEFEKDLQIMHPHNHKKMTDAFLTIKARICAPKILHCQNVARCLAQHGTLFEQEPPLKPKKKSKSRSAVHGDDCLCSRCSTSSNSSLRRSTSRRITSRRTTRPKI